MEQLCDPSLPHRMCADASQQQVIKAQHGHYLVLAPPGCGKTYVLTERICQAHEQGVDYDSMLCLTFTNRASREMIERIGQRVGRDGLSHLQVGSVHRYCSKFLQNGEHLTPDTSIIDEGEAINILADYMKDDAQAVEADFRRRKVYRDVIDLSHHLSQVAHCHPKEVYLHPGILSAADWNAFRQICRLQQTEPTRETFLDLYAHAESYINDGYAPTVASSVRDAIRTLTQRLYFAHCYATYKADNHLIDFTDLLLKTYDLYREHPEACKHYRWIQVDEVQDLNALQLAIVDQLTDDTDPTVMYLGDPQQAIFSFMGAKLDILEKLRQRCQGHLFHLSQNHRSPSYLLDVFNTYAHKVLGISPELLPTAQSTVSAEKGDLSVVGCNTQEGEVRFIAQRALEFSQQDATATTAVIVLTNRDADTVSNELTRIGLPHFKVSGADLFSSDSMKLLLAHLGVVAGEGHFIDWARLLSGLSVFSSETLSRRFLRKLRQLSLSPLDLLHPEEDGCTLQFVRHYEQEELVVFDTETTGLDTQSDDIIEISAMRMRDGHPVGEPLDLYLRTTRPIPEYLGDHPNPLYTLYPEKERAGELLSPAEALTRFLDYVGHRPLVGHNVQFDCHIVEAQMQRHLGFGLSRQAPVVIDTLRLARLLFPGLRSYKLESLLQRYHLEGQNSHQSIDDVEATVHLAAFCYRHAKEQAQAQTAFLRHPQVQSVVRKLCARYGDLYQQTASQLRLHPKQGSCPLADALEQSYNTLLADGTIAPIDKFGHVLRHVRGPLVKDRCEGLPLQDQLRCCLIDLNTMKEADFCNTGSVPERVYVTTVHKAKGLEFTNVIVYDVATGRYPSRNNSSQAEDQEDARKLYVALSRARKRLVVTFPLSLKGNFSEAASFALSPFMTPVLRYFTSEKAED